MDTETKIRTNNIVTITPEALDTYSECMTQIAEAYNWARDPKNYSLDDADVEKQWHENEKRVQEMERSFLSNWAQRTCQSQHYDGPLTISRDGFCSFFWIYTTRRDPNDPYCKPYHGAIIYHPAYKDGTEKMPWGTWSSHT